MSTYDGVVTPGGPSQARELGEVTIRKMSVSAMHNNVYLLSHRDGPQVLIDAADDAPRVLEFIAEGGGGRHGIRLDALITTHQHWDHVRALADVAAATGAGTYAGEDDADALPVAPDVRLQQGDWIAVGPLSLDVVYLRGHTPGSVALAYTDPADDNRVHLFTGDALFPGGVGNTKMPGQDFDSLYADVTKRIFDVYDDRTIVYPGHGADTILGVERPHLAEWRARGW
ncbi:MBL fold metallo-hydrolase [Nostocoides jenkinsii]|uniref:Putative Zn-dependent hydrolase n=1 Tax=Nostocoides jenkinsii Ben 74 TaxID=1193518 RepID=A0A077MB67_9MICO|nr:MBL fold metallo-hydrolase [Tetrasphaera jenkinsii]CCI54591.1 putative Zn-dependent hydrolase [Tetrasphaera jenkinsii Ben 74]